MNIFIRIIGVFLLAISVMGQRGCPGTPFEPTTGNATVTAVKEIKVGESFVITLKSNPTTGYRWNADFDKNFLSLVKSEYVPDSPEKIGSGGVEKFTFIGLKAGTTKITMNYKRLWEGEEKSIETQIFTVKIE